MNYLVIELQTANNITSHIAWSYNKLDQAESKYHAILSAAAVSSVPIHAATILNQEGNVIRSWFYIHESSTDNE